MTKENKDVETNEVGSNIDETDSSDETQNTDEETKVDNPIPYDRFKQKVDEANALKKKLADIEKAQKEAERKEMEESEEYKELYEQAQAEVEQAKAETLSIKKNAALANAGYDEDQAKLLIKLVEGDSDEEIEESVEELKTTIPAQDNYGDPSAFNGAKVKPKTVDNEELGRNAVSRVLHKIRL